MSFSDRNSFSDISDTIIVNTEASQLVQDQVDQDLVDQLNDEMDDVWWSNYQHEQWAQDQDVPLRRYPSRKRRLTVKAAALASDL